MKRFYSYGKARKAAIAVLLLLLAYGLLFGESYTLNDVLEAAYKNNADVLAADVFVLAAQSRLGQSYADLIIPQASLSGGLSLSGDATASAGISKTLFNGFKTLHAMTENQEALALAQAQAKDARKAVKLCVTLKFYHMLLLEESLSNTENSAASLLSLYQYNEALYKKGLATEITYLKSKLNYNSAEITRQKAMHDLELEKKALLNLTGLADNTIQFTGNFTSLLQTAELNTSLTDLTNSALTNSTDYASALQNIESAKISLINQNNAWMPVVSANANYGYGSQKNQDGTSGLKSSWSASLQASMDINCFIPFSKASKNREESAANLNLAEISLRQKANTVTLQTETLYIQNTDLLNTMNIKKDAMDLEEKNLAQIKKTQELGNTSALDTSEEEVLYLQARLSYYQSVYDYDSNFLNLVRMTDSNY